MFRVVADQLRLSEGWVRCGHCSEVFDAQANLQDPQAVVAAVAPVTSVSSSEAGAVSPPPVARSRRWRGPATQPSAGAAPSMASHERATLPEADQDAAFVDTPVTQPGALGDATDEAALPTENTELVESYPAIQLADDKPAELEMAHAEQSHIASQPQELPALPAQATIADPAPSFLQLARQHRRAQSPFSRMVWGFVSLVLLAAFLLQVLVSERHRLAAAQPQALALLTPMCEALNCVIGPPRDIASIRIDSSTFNKIRGDFYRLAFTVNSGAELPLELPHMELTLTDEQDRVLARRVLSSSDLPGSPAVMAPRGQWSGQWSVSVVSGELDGRVAGYRLLAFYP